MGSLTVGILKLRLGTTISVAFQTWMIAKNQPKKHLQKSERTGEFSSGSFYHRMIGEGREWSEHLERLRFVATVRTVEKASARERKKEGDCGMEG